MQWITIISTLLFIGLFVVGYKKNKRNVMALGTVFLLVALVASGTLSEFVAGFIDGFNAAQSD